ncbi:hypothetical protein B0H11DRAFT_2016920 [Mycena galericulata]|nr:hypothetical protein B0H11DRAFT_2016920 [Mycena galericulata]
MTSPLIYSTGTTQSTGRSIALDDYDALPDPMYRDKIEDVVVRATNSEHVQALLAPRGPLWPIDIFNAARTALDRDPHVSPNALYFAAVSSILCRALAALVSETSSLPGLHKLKVPLTARNLSSLACTCARAIAGGPPRTAEAHCFERPPIPAPPAPRASAAAHASEVDDRDELGPIWVRVRERRVGGGRLRRGPNGVDSPSTGVRQLCRSMTKETNDHRYEIPLYL